MNEPEEQVIVVTGGDPVSEATERAREEAQAPNGSGHHVPPPTPEKLSEEAYEAEKLRQGQEKALGLETTDNTRVQEEPQWVDPVEAFLTPKAKEVPESGSETYPDLVVERLRTKLRFRAIPTERYTKLLTENTKRRMDRQTNELYDSVDNQKVKIQAILLSAVNVNFNDRRLWEHFGVLDAEKCVARALLPGEIDRAYELIGRLSGYERVFNEEQAGNS